MKGIATCVACIGLALIPVAAVGEERTPPATAPSNSDDGITLDAHQKDIVRKISDYFSGIYTLQGSFLQTGSDNRRMKGKFYLSRPGRFRFDYARPSRHIVISDGRYLAVEDLDLNTEDRVELDQTRSGSSCKAMSISSVMRRSWMSSSRTTCSWSLCRTRTRMQGNKSRSSWPPSSAAFGPTPGNRSSCGRHPSTYRIHNHRAAVVGRQRT